MNEPLDRRNQRNQPPPSERPVPGAHGACGAGSGVRPRFSVVLTRPGEQSAELAHALGAAGIDVIPFPLIDIRPNPDTREIDAALRDIGRGAPGYRSCRGSDSESDSASDYSLVFFVSPNAIEQAFGRAQALGVPLADALACRDGTWPIVAVVGPGSVQALARYGVRSGTHRILAPAGALADANSSSNAASIRYDSEALVAALDAAEGRAALAGRNVLIVRGDGGREWFAETLREAGAQVRPVMAYQRAVPQPDETAWRRIEALLDGAPHVWVLTSSEGIRNLDTMARARFGEGAVLDSGAPHLPRFAALKRAPVIVTHPRIAAAAVSAGFDTITNPGAGDANIVRAVLAASEKMAIRA